MRRTQFSQNYEIFIEFTFVDGCMVRENSTWGGY